MLALTFDPVPTLVVDGESYHGINIIAKLNSIYGERLENVADIEDALIEAANAHQRIEIPAIGFRLEDPRAVMPSKRIVDVGYDLTAVEPAKQLTPMTTMFETHVALDIPLGFYVEIAPRSSLSKTGYMMANSIGVIDPCYTGTVKVALIKVDPSMPDLVLPARVAQMILKPYVVSTSFDATEHSRLETVRGNGGFGSTDQ